MTRQAKLATYFGVLATLFLGLQLLRASQLGIEDAVFLTKNSIKRFQTQYLCKSRRIGCLPEQDQNDNDESKKALLKLTQDVVHGMDLDLEFPFSNIFSSVFPIDLVVSYNTSNVTHELPARYASFSPVLNGKLTSQYAIVDGFGCSPLNATFNPQYKGKILIVLRGKCTFVRKVKNLVESDLKPRAVVVANIEPNRNLITMYSSTFNEDGSLTVPILFISNEDFKSLEALKLHNIQLSIETASIDNWVNLMLLMAVSPPLLIVFFYLLMRAIQLCHRRRVCTMNQRLVRRMVVYIFNTNHLIPAPKFYEYLTLTSQTGDIPLVVSSSDDLPNGHDESTDTEQPQPSTSFVINGTDLYSLKNLHLLFAQRDYYPTLKCSICLDRFVPLRSRVLVLECKHMYHELCLLNWLINFRRSCPLCNESLKLLETLPLLEPESATYDSFGVDLERGFNDSRPWPRYNLAWSQNSHDGNHQNHYNQDREHGTSARASTMAVRSLQLDIQSSNPRGSGSIGMPALLAHSGESTARGSEITNTENSTSDQDTGGNRAITQWESQASAPHVSDAAGSESLVSSRTTVPTFHSGGQSVDSDASFVTTRTQLYSDTSSSHYFTPQQSAELYSPDDTQLSTSSEMTIRNSEPGI